MGSTPNFQNFTVAIAGQPNTGKSTVFNLLTGLKQKVGNWAGKTVEKKSGFVPQSEGGYKVVDLPGTYSLNAHSEEECIAASFIADANPDLVVIIANAASPERTLYYALDCMLLGKPCIIALNMMDVAELNGKKINIEKLEKEFGIPVIPLIATKSYNVNLLFTRIKQRLEKPVPMHDITLQLEKLLSPEVQKIFNNLVSCLISEKSNLSTDDNKLTVQNIRHIAWQALENNKEALHVIEKNCVPHIKNHNAIFEHMQQARYAWLEQATEKTFSTNDKTISRTRRCDKYILHPFFGPIILLIIAIISTIVGIGMGLSLGTLIIYLIKPLESFLFSAIPTDFQTLQLMLKGVFRGVTSVLAMLPHLFVFYTIFALLEDVGYMSRAAVLMDRFMSKIGMNGKAFMPLLFSLPCNISGVMACRTIENDRIKKLIFLLIPLVPCTAKFVVLITLVAWLFPPAYGALVVLGISSINIIVLIIICKIFGMFTAKEDGIRLMMELPYYHRPNMRIVARSVITQCTGFIKKAATLIVSFSVIIWFLSYYPTGNIETSLLGQFGKFFEPIGQLMGVDWRILTALFSSFLSKETTIATLGIVYNATPIELPTVLKSALTPAAGIAFLCAQNLFIPCIATLGMLYKESRSKLLTFGILAYTLLLPFIVGPIVFMLCSAFL